MIISPKHLTRDSIHTCPILRHRGPAQRVELSGDILRQLLTPVLSRTEDQYRTSFLYRLQTKLYNMVIVPLSMTGKL